MIGKIVRPVKATWSLFENSGQNAPLPPGEGGQYSGRVVVSVASPGFPNKNFSGGWRVPTPGEGAAARQCTICGGIYTAKYHIFLPSRPHPAGLPATSPGGKGATLSSISAAGSRIQHSSTMPGTPSTMVMAKKYCSSQNAQPDSLWASGKIVAVRPITLLKSAYCVAE